MIGLVTDPGNVKLLVRLAEARWNLGRKEKSLATLRNALAIAPNDKRLAELYAKMSREAEASSRR